MIKIKIDNFIVILPNIYKKYYNLSYYFCIRVSCWILLCFTLMITTACSSKNLGISTAQMVPEPVNEEWVIDAPFDVVWAAITVNAQKNAYNILVSSKNDGIISWCDPVENWSDLEQGTVMPKSLVGGVD